MMEQDVITLLRENIEAFNAGDATRIGTTLADGAVYDERGTQRRVQGRDEIVQTVLGWREAFPDAQGTIQNIFASGDRAVAEILWQGTHSGDLMGPTGTISATGKRIQVPATMVVTTEGGKIKENHHYFDMMTLLQQIGAVPQPNEISVSDNLGRSLSKRM